jgi:hypothetical protein
MQASLSETFMWAKFQVKIQKYSVGAKVGSYRENSLKTRYLVRKTPGARTIFMVDIVHQSLQDAHSPGSKAIRHLEMFPRKYNFEQGCVDPFGAIVIFGIAGKRLNLIISHSEVCQKRCGNKHN